MLTTEITGVAPVLLVKNVQKTAEYFHDKIGFHVDLFGDPVNFCIAHRDGIRIMFAQCENMEKHLPNWKLVEKMWDAYFWVDNIDELYDQLQKSGAIIDYSIYNAPHGVREFGIQDLDEHDIAFGQVIIN